MLVQGYEHSSPKLYFFTAFFFRELAVKYTVNYAVQYVLVHGCQVSEVLETSMLHIDDMVAVFNNF